MNGTAVLTAVPEFRQYTERHRVVETTVSSGTAGATGLREGIPSQTVFRKKTIEETTKTVFFISDRGGSIPSDEMQEQVNQSTLDYVYVIAEAGFVREALDAVFQRMNALLTSGKFTVADKMLAQADVERLSPTLLVGFLSITLASSKFLIERPQFYAKVNARIRAERGPEAAARLLNKYGR